ncbi:hypothetical protein FRX31_011487 [Thalictrum thalictroides]|uniref:Phytosulfokine n=1 Tax=Thalictrum thalictroides TaxID=46969 RepID=A0A7J6WNG4_THATH|nr:hypothetical protein FRX31_011487 [Thalictrum thalictroides]
MKNQSFLLFHSHHGLLVLLLLLVLLSSSFTTLEARFLTPKQGLESGVDGLLQMNHVVKKIEAEDSLDLMGMEDHCGNGDDDEDCLQRRMIAEAHLDYIYTQHHKP